MANYGYKGWIKLWREEMHNPLYTEEPFDRWHAWMDLCMIASDDGTVKTSLEALKNRWFWGSKGKVTRFLRTLSGTGIVTVHGTANKGTLIRINTDFSAKSKRANGTVNGTENETKNGIEEENTSKEVAGSSTQAASRASYRSNKNLNNNNNINNNNINNNINNTNINNKKKSNSKTMAELVEELDDDEYE